jgi:hypothetical protein
MKLVFKLAGVVLPLTFAAGVFCSPASAQIPAPATTVPVVVDTAVPIIVAAVKPAPKNVGLVKFQGYVMNANSAQITLRDKKNELAIRTFPLSQQMSAKMQKIVDKGGYQYGDKVTVYYDPSTEQARNFKGKPSNPI